MSDFIAIITIKLWMIPCIFEVVHDICCTFVTTKQSDYTHGPRHKLAGIPPAKAQTTD